jgi:hypothetical protein
LAGTRPARTISRAAAATAVAVSASAIAVAIPVAAVIPAESADLGTAAGTLRPFRGNDQLQQFLRIVEEFVGLFRIQSQRARGKLRCDCGLSDGRVGRHKTYFVNMNVRITLQRSLQLLG